MSEKITKVTRQNYQEVQKRCQIQVDHLFNDINRYKLEVSILKKDVDKLQTELVKTKT